MEAGALDRSTRHTAALASGALSPVLEAQVKGRFSQAEGSRGNHRLDQGDGRKNRLWGAERICGELLKLGIHVCKRTIQKYSAPFWRLLDSSEGAEGRERNTLLGQPTYL